MFSSNPQGAQWAWLQQLQQSYHKSTQANINTWLTKATLDNENPPKAKHVRRVIVACLRDPAYTPTYIASFLICERPWQVDPRISAKSLFLILIVLQYQVDVASYCSINSMIERVVTYYSTNPPDKRQLYASVAQRIGAIIRSKLAYHGSNPNVEGNFSIPKVSKQQYSSPEFIDSLRRHLFSVHYETSGVMAAVTSSEDFAATVLWQPMVDETVSAYRLLKSIDYSQESADLLHQCEELIKRLPQYPYIATTVIFPEPGERVTIPRERFPRQI